MKVKNTSLEYISKVSLFVAICSFFLSGCSKDANDVIKYEDLKVIRQEEDIVETKESNNIEFDISEVENTEKEIDTLDLTESEIREWVMLVLDFKPEIPTKYLLDISLNESDNLIYISARIDQLDGNYRFRINALGQLEEDKNTDFFGDQSWAVVSEKFLDTTIVQEEKAEREERKKREDNKPYYQDMTFNQACDYIKSRKEYWIGISPSDKSKIRDVEVVSKTSDREKLDGLEYYNVVLKTDIEENSIIFQFRVYVDGTVEQIADGNGSDNWIEII